MHISNFNRFIAKINGIMAQSQIEFYIELWFLSRTVLHLYIWVFSLISVAIKEASVYLSTVRIIQFASVFAINPKWVNTFYTAWIRKRSSPAGNPAMFRAGTASGDGGIPFSQPDAVGISLRSSTLARLVRRRRRSSRRIRDVIDLGNVWSSRQIFSCEFD